MSNQGVSVNDVVNVSVALTPAAAQIRNFGNLLILGDSDVIGTTQRLRLYTSLASVAGDFLTTSPEYLAATLFFAQSPQPAQLYIGRWAATASRGALNGGVLTPAEQLLSNFTGIVNGGMALTIDGVAHNLAGMNFTGSANLNGVAAVVQAALGGSGTVTWNPLSGSFQVRSTTTGVASTVAFATAGPGTDMSTLLNLDAGSGGNVEGGQAAETLLAAVTLIDNMTSAWYGLMVAAGTNSSVSDLLGVAQYIEAAQLSHVFGITTADSSVLNPAVSADIASVVQGAHLNRTFVQYSTSSPYAVASVFGRAFTVDFAGSNTVITLKFQQEPGVTAETLTETQAQTLNQKNANVFINYNNGTAILQQGTMASGQFFDTVHGTDSLENDAQTAIFNALFTSTTKIPQTDAGVNVLVTALANIFDKYVDDGLIAPGVWNGPPVGAIVTGQTLASGYYIYAPPIASQSVAARAARQAPVISGAIKLAGAIHSSNVVLSVNP